jgi:hypothetical protein
VEAPKPEVKPVESKEAETAPTEAKPAGQPHVEKVTAVKGDQKAERKEAEDGAPAAKAAQFSKADEKIEGKQEGGKQAASSGRVEDAASAAAGQPGKSDIAADVGIEKATVEDPSDAVRKLAGEGVPAASKGKHAEEQVQAQQPAGAAAAPQQILAPGSAPSQVDVLGSIEVAAPLQVGPTFRDYSAHCM